MKVLQIINVSLHAMTTTYTNDKVNQLLVNFQRRGSKPLCTRVPPNQNCTPLSTPKSELYALHVPPNQKLYQKGFFLAIFLTRTPG
jgi:hypothetical protein